MYLRSFLFALLAAAVLVAPAAASTIGLVGVSQNGPCSAETSAPSTLGEPFGNVEGHGITGATAASGSFPLVGWALDNSGVQRIEIQVDGISVGQAQLLISRPDVGAIFPSFPGSAFAGWEYQLDTTRFLNGLHEVTALVVSNTGEIRRLNTIVMEFSNTTHNLKPFGNIAFPDHNSEMFGTCDPDEEDRRYSVVTGWALDAGLERNDHGVGYVELLIDGSIYANSRRDCVHSVITGAYTNCFGQPRLDVEREYEFLKDSPNAGFRFVLDVGRLISDFGYREGLHTLTIRSGDLDSQVSNIDTINVNWVCDEFVPNEGALGSVDVPSGSAIGGEPSNQTSGFVEISGWALDRVGVARVLVYVDGVGSGDATYGFPRPAITDLYPGFVDSAAPGWLYTLDTTSLTNGPHTINVIVRDRSGHDTLIGEVILNVLN